MLRVSLLANAEILSEAKQGSYFFNRIGRELTSKLAVLGLGDQGQVGAGLAPRDHSLAST